VSGHIIIPHIKIGLMGYNMKSIFKQLICIIIILLLVGVSYTSAIRVENKTSIVKIEEDCGCNEVSDTDIVGLEKQLDSLEVYSKLLLVLSRNNPELKEITYEIFEIIDSINLWDFPIICDILESAYESLDFAYESAYGIYNNLSDNSILGILIVPWLISLEFMIYIVFSLIGFFYCWGPYHP
jgi:hypothetical protein